CVGILRSCDLSVPARLPGRADSAATDPRRVRVFGSYSAPVRPVDQTAFPPSSRRSRIMRRPKHGASLGRFQMLGLHVSVNGQPACAAEVNEGMVHLSLIISGVVVILSRWEDLRPSRPSIFPRSRL